MNKSIVLRVSRTIAAKRGGHLWMPSECSAPVIHSERIKIITVLPPNIIIARNAIKLLRPIMDQIVSARMKRQILWASR